MKANPAEVQTSYLIEGLFVGFFIGLMISVAIDWQWIGIGVGIGQFLGTIIGSQISKKEKRQKKSRLITHRILNHFITKKSLVTLSNIKDVEICGYNKLNDEKEAY